MATLYRERKDARLCVRCGERSPEGKQVSCQRCLDVVNARRRGGRHDNGGRVVTAAEFNECCIAAGFHRVDCPKRKEET